MTQGAKIGLIIGGISVVGVAVWLIIKNRNHEQRTQWRGRAIFSTK